MSKKKDIEHLENVSDASVINIMFERHITCVMKLIISKFNYMIVGLNW